MELPSATSLPLEITSTLERLGITKLHRGIRAAGGLARMKTDQRLTFQLERCRETRQPDIFCHHSYALQAQMPTFCSVEAAVQRQ